MVIARIDFPLYGIIIVLSVIVGMLYVYCNLKKDGCKNKQILLYFIMYMSFAFIGGKMYNIVLLGELNFFTAGLSSYGGLIGVVIASIVFEKILPSDGKIIKYTILSLPLVYALTKIGCFIGGCCSGIPYDGIFKVKYVDVLDIWQFPIQICETIVFLLLFVVFHFMSKNRNINYVILILLFTFKFTLDFFRYDHVDVLLTTNQILSIFLLIVTIFMLIKNKFNDMVKKSKI